MQTNVHYLQSGNIVRVHPAVDNQAESGLVTVIRRLITVRGVDLMVRWNLTGIESTIDYRANDSLEVIH
jgi:hypothetical protein